MQEDNGTSTRASTHLSEKDKAGELTWLPVLFPLLVIGLLVLNHLRAQDPRLLRANQKTRNERYARRVRQRMVRHDPPLGAGAPKLNFFDSEGKTVSVGDGGEPEILVFFGACSSCNKASILRWVEFRERLAAARVHLITSDARERVKEFLRAEQIRTVMICDKGGAAAKVFNAFWFPRSYIIDRDGRLIYAQSDLTTDSQALRAIEQILRGIRAEPLRHETRPEKND